MYYDLDSETYDAEWYMNIRRQNGIGNLRIFDPKAMKDNRVNEINKNKIN